MEIKKDLMEQLIQHHRNISKQGEREGRYSTCVLHQDRVEMKESQSLGEVLCKSQIGCNSRAQCLLVGVVL